MTTYFLILYSGLMVTPCFMLGWRLSRVLFAAGTASRERVLALLGLLWAMAIFVLVTTTARRVFAFFLD